MAWEPTNVTATVNIVGYSAGSISVAWTNNPPLDGYELGLFVSRNGSNVSGTLAGTDTNWVDSSFSFDVTYSYTVTAIGYSTSAASNSVTPKQLLAPGNLNAWSTGVGQGNLTWTNYGSTYDQIQVKRDGGTVATIGGAVTGHIDGGLGADGIATYWVEGEISGYGARASNTDTCAAWTTTVTDTLTLTDSVPGAGLLFSVTVTDTLTLTDSVTASITATATVSDVLTLTDTITAVTTYNVTIADTLTLTDSVFATQNLRTNYSYYLGSTSGAVYAHDGQYLSDGGTAISSFWNSKRIDFADQHPDIIDKRKTLYKITLHYEDLSASTLIMLHVSTDGGATWTTSDKTVGTGAGTIKEADFYFLPITGRMFNFKVESSGTDKSFKFIGLMVEFEECGKYFEV